MPQQAPMTRPMTRDETDRLLRRATYASVAVAILLSAIKFGAWIATGSVSLLSSLLDSLLDAASSLVMLFAIRQALTPADAEHRFGHGKAEPLAALAQSAFIAGSAIFLLAEAVQRLLAPEPVQQPLVGLAVMGASVLITFALTRYQRHVVRRSGSIGIASDSLHYLGDLLSNLAVVAAILVSYLLDWPLADPLFAIAIAAYILRTAWTIGRQALDMLMDRELPEADRARIAEMVLADPEVRGLHQLRTRSAGQRIFIQMHVELEGTLSLTAAHAIAARLQTGVSAAFDGAEVLVHQDPAGLAQEPRSTF